MSTLIVAARNEQETIERMLESVCAQTQPPEAILLGVNATTDNTANLARQFANVRTFEYEAAGKARTLNELLKHCETENVLLADADVILQPKAVETVEEAFEKGALAVQTAHKYVHTRTNKSRVVPSKFQGGFCAVHLPTAFNIAHSLQIPLFPEHIINEDAYLRTLLFHAQVPIHSISRPLYTHYAPCTIKDTILRQARIEVGKRQLVSKYPQLFEDEPRASKISLYAKLYALNKRTNPSRTFFTCARYLYGVSLSLVAKAIYTHCTITGEWTSPTRKRNLFKGCLEN
ncbi:MAG: glycosyltransferase [Candidatus Woesearchaeota archaeon]